MHSDTLKTDIDQILRDKQTGAGVLHCQFISPGPALARRNGAYPGQAGWQAFCLVGHRTDQWFVQRGSEDGGHHGSVVEGESYCTCC